MLVQSQGDFNIQVRKWDGKQHYRWKTHLLLEESGFVWVACQGPRNLEHQTKGQTFTFQTHAMEWFWKDAWFSLGVSLDPVNRQTRFYCNLHQPFIRLDHTIEFVDLDIDVIKVGDSPSIQEDLDEFEEHSVKYGYPKVIIDRLPELGVDLGRAIDSEEMFGSAQLAELFDSVMHEETGGLKSVERKAINDLISWPETHGLGRNLL